MYNDYDLLVPEILKTGIINTLFFGSLFIDK